MIRDIISYGNKAGRIDVTTDGITYKIIFKGKHVSEQELKRILLGYPMTPELYELIMFVRFQMSLRLHNWRIKYGKGLKDAKNTV